MGKTVLLGTATEFHCTSFASQHLWLINNSRLDLTPSGVHGVRGITRCLAHEVTGSIFESTLCVNAIAINNNTVIQCALSRIQSEPVILRIQSIELFEVLYHDTDVFPLM